MNGSFENYESNFHNLRSKSKFCGFTYYSMLELGVFMHISHSIDV